MSDPVTFDDITRLTLARCAEDPLDFNAYFRYVASDQWRPRSPFIYADDVVAEGAD